MRDATSRIAVSCLVQLRSSPRSENIATPSARGIRLATVGWPASILRSVAGRRPTRDRHRHTRNGNTFSLAAAGRVRYLFAYAYAAKNPVGVAHRDGAGIGLLVGRSTAPASEVELRRQEEADVGLDRLILELNVEDASISEVFDRLSQQTRTNIAVNWKALQDEGVHRAKPVTLRLWNLPLRRALDLACNQAGGGNASVRWRVDRGVIEVSTKEALTRVAVARIYDVRDILTDYAASQQRINTCFPPTTQPATTTNGGGDATLFGPSNPRATTAADAEEALMVLADLIEETVDPESWREAGGAIGSIYVFGGRLIVVTTPDSHARIEQLLALVRTGQGEVRVP